MSSTFPQPPADGDTPAASTGLPENGAAEPASPEGAAAAGTPAVAATDAGAPDVSPQDTGPAAEPVTSGAMPEPEPASGSGPAAAPDTSPAATARQLRELFPALFAGNPKPLKLRIQHDIQERAPGRFTKPVLTAFFRRYTGSHGYLLAVSKASHRFDLDGAPAGELSAEHKQIAIDELARRRGNTEARRAVEEEQRRNRATLLHDFERTTLTAPNFCALKGITEAELEEYLTVARREAAERPPEPPHRPMGRDDRHEGRRPEGAGPAGRPGGPAEGRRGAPPEGRRGPNDERGGPPGGRRGTGHEGRGGPGAGGPRGPRPDGRSGSPAPAREGVRPEGSAQGAPHGGLPQRPPGGERTSPARGGGAPRGPGGAPREGGPRGPGEARRDGPPGGPRNPRPPRG